ncbi:transposase [Bifidobacterium longum subsp. longum]|nr:transposase [Bifidobacterium longum subsp. longum]
MCEARRAEYVRLLDEEGMNFTQAAHAVGVSKRTGKAWRNGRTRATGKDAGRHRQGEARPRQPTGIPTRQLPKELTKT